MPRKDVSSLGPDRAREIAEECYGEVLAYCRRHVPAGHDAADLAQETFLRFVRAKGYAERGRPIAYLMRIARSACVDAARERRLETVTLDFEVADDERGEAGSGLDDALAKLPYFLSCAGCLMAQRLAPPSTAAALCAVWALACGAGLAVLANTLPGMYANASLAVWAGAAAVAGVWLVREVAMTCRAAAAGLDAFSPHMARTYN